MFKKVFLIFYLLIIVSTLHCQTDIYISNLTETTTTDTSWIMIIESPTTTYKITYKNLFKYYHDIYDTTFVKRRPTSTEYLFGNYDIDGRLLPDYLSPDTLIIKDKSSITLQQGELGFALYGTNDVALLLGRGGTLKDSIPSYRWLRSNYAELTDTSSLLATRYWTTTNFLEISDSTLYATRNWVTSNYVPTSRTVSTTSPLSGGGALSSNLTLTIANAAADGITKGAATFVATDFNSTAGLISIDYTNGQAASGSTKGFLTSTDWTTFNNKIGLSSLSATAPLTYNSGTGAFGLDYNTTNLKLTANQLNTIQDIAASSSPTFVNLTLSGDAAINGGDITSTTNLLITPSGNLTANPTGDFFFNPSDNDILPTNNYDLNLGSLTKKYLTLHAAELWVETLVAQNTIATIGGRILVGPTTTLVADINTSDITIYVKHNSAAVNDIVYLEADGKVEFMRITAGPYGTSGNYYYTVTRNLDATGANLWYAGDAVFNTGYVGDGFIDLYSIAGVKSATQYGPTIVGNVRNSSTFNDWSEHWAIGNLNGIYGYTSDTYGSAFGKYSNSSSFVTIDNVNGIRFRYKNSGGTVTDKMTLDMSGNATFTGTVTITNPSTFNNGNPLNTTDLTNNSNWDNTTDGLQSGVTITGGGITLSTNAVIKSGQAAYQTGTGYWIGVSAGTPKFSIGNSTTEYLSWSGTTLSVRGSIYMDDGTISWASVNEPTKSDLGTWTTYIDANGIYTGTLTADQVNAVNVIADSIVANKYIYSPHIVGGDIAIGSGNSIFKADANGIYLGNGTFGSAPFRVSPAGLAIMTSANIAGWSIDASKIERVTYDGSKWLYVDLFSTFSSYATGLQVRAEQSSVNKIIVNAGSYNDGAAARYGFSIWDAINSQWLMNVGYGGPTNNLSAQIAGFSFDYQKMYAGTATAGISLNKNATPFITGATAKGFEVYDVSDPKMFIGKKDGDYLDWNVTTASALTIKGRMISSWISTAAAQSGNYTYAALYSSTVRSQKYTDADNYWDARLEDGKITVVNRESAVTNTIIIDKDGLKLNGYRNARWLGSYPGGSIGDGRDGDIVFNTSLMQIGIWAYGAWRWL